MAKFVSTQVQDRVLDAIAGASQLFLCAGQPINASDASTRALGQTSVSPGDFSKATAGSSRRLDVKSKTGINITKPGTVDHIALVGGGDLLYVTTTSANAVVTSGSTATVGAWSITVNQPS